MTGDCTPSSAPKRYAEYAMTIRIITLPVFCSPVLLLCVLYETFENNAYPPQADSLGIPLFGYLIFYCPLAFYFASKIKAKKLSKPTIKLWNDRRDFLSLLSLVLSIYPLGYFWFGLAAVSLGSQSFISFGICIVMLFCTAAVRTYAIQDNEKKEHLSPSDG